MTRVVRLVVMLALFSLGAFAQTEVTTASLPVTRFHGRGIQDLGTYKVYQCTTPAAGAEWICTVPSGKVWRVISMTFTLVTNATVANRIVVLNVKDPATNVIWKTTSGLSHVASTTYSSNVITPCFSLTGSTQSVVWTPFLCDTTFGPGYVFTTVTANIQVGDQYSAVNVFVEEWNR